MASRLDQELLALALKEKLDQQQLAMMQNYINPEYVADLFNLSNELQLNRTNPALAMMTSSSGERESLADELNNMSRGFGNDADRVEQFARLKALDHLQQLKRSIAASDAFQITNDEPIPAQAQIDMMKQELSRRGMM